MNKLRSPQLGIPVSDSYGKQYLVDNINPETGLGTVHKYGTRNVSKKKFMKLNGISKGQYKQMRFNSSPKRG